MERQRGWFEGSLGTVVVLAILVLGLLVGFGDVRTSAFEQLLASIQPPHTYATKLRVEGPMMVTAIEGCYAVGWLKNAKKYAVPINLIQGPVRVDFPIYSEDGLTILSVLPGQAPEWQRRCGNGSISL